MNKPRLIDANELIGALRESHKHHANNSKEESLLMRDIAIVNEMPTAYDIDKIVAEITEVKDTVWCADETLRPEQVCDIIYEIIEIVKGGADNDT